jgi:phosphoribosylanthranilate isomerase
VFKIKICGMQTPEDVDICSSAGADALGFIFAKSGAQIGLDIGRRLASLVPSGILRVGVFANNEASLVREAIDRLHLDALQFCGEESPEFRGFFGLPTIVSIGLGPRGSDLTSLLGSGSLQTARAMAVLVDSRVGGKLGGTGVCVDRDVARSLAACTPLPLVLAGGLTPENVREVVATVRPAGVDVRSGVERNGRKQPQLVRQFVEAARTAIGVRP